MHCAVTASPILYSVQCHGARASIAYSLSRADRLTHRPWLSPHHNDVIHHYSSRPIVVIAVRPRHGPRYPHHMHRLRHSILLLLTIINQYRSDLIQVLFARARHRGLHFQPQLRVLHTRR